VTGVAVAGQNGRIQRSADDSDQIFKEATLAGSPGDGQEGALKIDVQPRLPPLAWLVDLSDAEPRLICGTGVETSGSRFFEGCWAGEFGDWDFDRVEDVFGSGGKTSKGEALFVTPLHTLDAIYVLESSGRFMVANSLPFLVQAAGLELPYDPGIGSRFASIKDGIEAYERVILQGSGWTLYRIVRENIVIRGPALRLVPKPSAPLERFTDYASYRGLLLDTLDHVQRNGASPSRKVRYSLLATCSSGYDSTASTALAATLGCRQALTLRTGGGINVPDSGRQAAKALGLEVTELERVVRAVGGDFKEAEFFATGLGAGDFAFRAFAPHCEQRILLTGFHGDITWDRHAPTSNSLARKDLSGSTLTELRLRHGFVNVPVPFIGATRHEVLLRIANSEEMRSWQVGGHYDRPIARRIAEECGVPRGCFAQSKKGSGITSGHLFGFWSEAALRDLKQFERGILARQGNRVSYYARWAGQSATQVALAVIGKPAGRIGLGHLRDELFHRLPGIDTLSYRHARYNSMACLWAVDRLRSRYTASPAPPARAKHGSTEPPIGGHSAPSVLIPAARISDA
jgi:hypothetical protein